ncbi:monovalent cation/H(+) antiporter subunit G [Propionibacteriaceae bacterium G1746]|uniref:monovalent cation/H(+) antiporter subunit G n=1 Tax=Aestuariimicrobium sp. G57 TaxID=3418485 RepID=UPI003C2378AE
MTEVIDLVAALFVCAGAFFCLSAAVGIVRFPDVITRLHAATKPQVFGLILILVGVALRMWTWQVTLLAILIAIFQVLTAPVSAHMVSRTAYRLGIWQSDHALVEELGQDLEGAGFVHPAEEEEPGEGSYPGLRWKPAQAWLPPSRADEEAAAASGPDEHGNAGVSEIPEGAAHPHEASEAIADHTETNPEELS